MTLTSPAPKPGFGVASRAKVPSHSPVPVTVTVEQQFDTGGGGDGGWFMHRKVKYVPEAGKLPPHEPEKVHAFRGRSVGHVTLDVTARVARALLEHC